MTSTDVPIPSVELIYEALTTIIDPELGLNFVELGLIYDVTVAADGGVDVLFTLTSPACPILETIQGQVVAAVSAVPGVSSVSATLTWLPMWTAQMMTDDAKFAFGY